MRSIRPASVLFLLLLCSAAGGVDAARGPRLTGGAYAWLGRADRTRTKGGVTLAYEQPLTRRLGFAADWMSGRNRFGYLSAGLVFAASRRGVLYAGYQVGNEGRKNNNLFVNLGFTF